MNKAIKTFIVCALLTTMCHTSERKPFENNDIIYATQDVTLEDILIKAGTLCKVNKSQADGQMTVEGFDSSHKLQKMPFPEKIHSAFSLLKDGDVVEKNCSPNVKTIIRGSSEEDSQEVDLPDDFPLGWSYEVSPEWIICFSSSHYFEINIETEWADTKCLKVKVWPGGKIFLNSKQIHEIMTNDVIK